MKVALIGNMNNNFFAITRHLRDRGYDAHLFYRVGMEHFQPSADTYSKDYVEYCHEVNWLDKGICNIDEAQIQTELRGFDFFIGQGDEAAAAYRAGINMDVYYPYGSDVYKYAQLPQEFLLRHKLVYYLKSKNIAQTKNMLRKGTPSKSMHGVIANAKYVWVDHTNEDFEKELEKLNCKGVYENVPMPFIYPKAYDAGMQNEVQPWHQAIKEAREKNELLILYHGRQEWKSNYNEFTPKNTHHLILGFAEYVKQTGANIGLVMLEYGYDLEHSRQLIAELGIADRVTWLPKMYRKDIMGLIRHADICSGEFGRSYLTFGTIAEAMCMAKPVIHYRDDNLYENKFPSLYPLLNAREPMEISKAIMFAVANPAALQQMGAEAAAWISEYFINKPLDKLQALIEKKAREIGYKTNHTAFSEV